MTTKQKLVLAALGGGLAIQGALITNMARVSIDVANTADTLFDIVHKHADKIDEDDLQTLRNIPLLKGKI